MSLIPVSPLIPYSFILITSAPADLTDHRHLSDNGRLQRLGCDDCIIPRLPPMSGGRARPRPALHNVQRQTIRLSGPNVTCNYQSTHDNLECSRQDHMCLPPRPGFRYSRPLNPLKIPKGRALLHSSRPNYSHAVNLCPCVRQALSGVSDTV